MSASICVGWMFGSAIFPIGGPGWRIFGVASECQVETIGNGSKTKNIVPRCSAWSEWGGASCPPAAIWSRERLAWRNWTRVKTYSNLLLCAQIWGLNPGLTSYHNQKICNYCLCLTCHTNNNLRIISWIMIFLLFLFLWPARYFIDEWLASMHILRMGKP